jgi:hypothetical protein
MNKPTYKLYQFGKISQTTAKITVLSTGFTGVPLYINKSNKIYSITVKILNIVDC